MAKIKFKRTSTVGRRPTGLESGEIGINLADRKIYVGDDSGAIIQLGNDPITTERLQAKAGATIANGLTVSGNQTNTGTITASGDVKGATVTSTGKATLGSVGTGALTATGVSTSTLTATGNTTLAGTKTGPLESTTLNATGVATVASLQTPGAISAGGNAVITGKVNAGSVETVSVVATGDVKGATVTATGKATVGSIGTGAITASSLVATGDVKSATVTTTGKAKSGSVETGAITGSTIAATGNVTTSAKITANEIELTKYDNFDSRYIKTGAAITNATKLSTPRKIAGVDFDGSADISIPAENVGALALAGGTLTGNVRTSGDIISTKSVEGQQVRSTYRMGIYRNTTPYFDFIRPDIITADALPATNQTTGMLRFNEGSKTTDIHGGLVRAQLNHSIQTDGSGQLIIDNRDSAGAVKNRIRMYTSDGSTRVDVGSFVAGATTLGTTTTGALTASSATINGTLTGTGSLTLNSANAGVELGSLTTAGSPYIDFHTSGTNVDYDIRLIANNTSLSVVSRLSILEDFNLKSIRNLRMNDSASSSLIMCRGSTIIRDHANGNVTISASKKSDTDTVGGDLYLGYNASTTNLTNTVRLESPLWWKGTTQLVSSAGKLIGASLDTEYLPLTGGALTGSVSITRNGTPGVDFINSAIDTTVALPTATAYSGSITFNENRAGTNMIRSKIESIIATTGATQLNMYVRDGSNATKSQIRMESDTGLVNIATGGLRVAGAVSLSNNLTVAGTSTLRGSVTTGELTSTGALSVSMAAPNLQLRAANTDTRQYVMAYKNNGVNSWYVGKANGNSEGLALWNYDGSCGMTAQPDGNVQIVTGDGGECTFNKTGMIYISRTPTGSDQALIRGTVEPGSHADWRGRGAGLQVDCPAANTSAYNIWKATQWGKDHIAAMDVHMPKDANSTVLRLITGSAVYYFYGNGDISGVTNFTANANGYFNDVYIRSDERLKRNLVKLNSALDKVDQLNGYSYEKRMSLESEEYNTKEVGLIAQELQVVLPDAVSEGKDDLLKISPSAVNALLVEAIKELRREVNELKSQINKGA